jgi:hypothetical protein
VDVVVVAAFVVGGGRGGRGRGCWVVAVVARLWSWLLGCGGGGCWVVVVDAVVDVTWLQLCHMWLVDQVEVSRDACVIYFLNNQTVTCPFSSAVWCAVIHRPKESEFDSRCEHLFLNII